MIYQVDYEYNNGPYGPYQKTIYLEANNLCDVEKKFEVYNSKNHLKSYKNDKGKIVKLMPSGQIYKVTALGAIEITQQL